MKDKITHLDQSLIDLVSSKYPMAMFQRRALEAEFLNETTLRDVLTYPQETAFKLRMTTGLGPKSLSVVQAALNSALDDLFGADWVYNISLENRKRSSIGVISVETMGQILLHWPRPAEQVEINETTDKKIQPIMFISRHKR